ncbi:MAG: GIY-YIG nuclease family protein [Stanieria sp.]
MTSQTEISTLANLDYIAYLNEEGDLQEDFQGKIGVYAIFDQEKILQFIGYSRDIYLSLKQHLVRQPQSCYWLKIQTIARPNRTILEEIRQTWISENGKMPPGNGEQEVLWIQPIDTKFAMTEEEKAQYQTSDELGQIKILKKVARRREEEVKEQLKQRGVTMDIRFNPKLKEQGLLDLK